jgi:hypothetical protein
MVDRKHQTQIQLDLTQSLNRALGEHQTPINRTLKSNQPIPNSTQPHNQVSQVTSRPEVEPFTDSEDE